jgi:SAM-dependent methyltransferase
MNPNNKYTVMQKGFYDGNAKKMALTDHEEHNANKDYWDVLLGDLKVKNGVGLDFGCGTGRNVKNLLSNWYWDRVDGIDISEQNVIEARRLLSEFNKDKYEFFFNNGIDLSPLNSDEYDFVMSTIVFQHISVYEIRFSLLKEIYRVLKTEGLFSFQMGYGTTGRFKTVAYHDNFYDAKGTNSDCNVRVDNADEVKSDLEKIGFKDIEITIRDSFSDAAHPKWIYVKAKK